MASTWYWRRRGLSPRVRGNLLQRTAPLDYVGTIPACAGEPPSRSRRGPGNRDYPRVCGGTPARELAASRGTGLSPRVRGNPKAVPAPPPRPRTIPACAGEPAAGKPDCTGRKDYPRVCGGTEQSWRESPTGNGLSPRVRGNLFVLAFAVFNVRTIPACAGEPVCAAVSVAGLEDYPRVCGGTGPTEGCGPRWCGLSPRVRGNPGPTVAPARRRGTIPACAGEPSTPGPPHTWAGDYPRVCGGTPGGCRPNPAPAGLSPRVRGNHSRPIPAQRTQRTIPACAGEPWAAAAASTRAGDYPRVCGGTGGHALSSYRCTGLSPRVRGNPTRGGRHWISNGTIPACAGEPYRHVRRQYLAGDYPRVCGGTGSATLCARPCPGLSPRVRGNLALTM